MLWPWFIVTLIVFSGAPTIFAQETTTHDGREGTNVDCPEDIYFFVNTTSDLSREIYIRLPADSLDMCISLCYGNQFCFSTIYEPENTDKECGFSYHSAYNCTRKELVTSHNETGSNYTIIECLRCPALGELTTTTEATEVTTNLQVLGQGDFDPDRKTQIPGELLQDTTIDGGSQASTAAPETTQAAASTAQAQSTAAQGTTEANTTQAATTQANTTLAETDDGDGTTLAATTASSNKTDSATTAGSNATESGTTTAGNGTDANTTLAATTEESVEVTTDNATGAAVIEATVVSVTKSGEEAVATTTDDSAYPRGYADTGVFNCSAGEIRSFWESTDLEKDTNFSSHRSVDDAEMCAIHCYAQGCTRAGYEPNSGSDGGGVCLLSFDEDDGENCTALEADGARVNFTDVNVTSTISIYCVACFLDAETTTAASSETTTDSAFPKGYSDTGVFNCSAGDIRSFWETEEVDEDAFSGQRSVEDAEQCAIHCYAQGCTRAAYQPNTESDSGGTCYVSFDEDDGENCTALESDGARVNFTDTTITSSISIYCVACFYDLENDTATGSETESESATTVEATTAFHSTTAVPATTDSSSSSSCSDTLSFVVVSTSESKLGSVDSTESASSAKDCASICYDNENCTVAGYQPAAEGSNLATEGVCLLSTTEISECSDDDESVTEYDDATSQPILLHCIECASYKKSVGKIEKAEVDFNLERIPVSRSTEQPLFQNQVQCYSCISNEPCNTGSCIGSYCVVQAQRNDFLGITVISHTCGIGKAVTLKAGCHLITVESQTTLTCVCADEYCNNGDRISDFLLAHPQSTLSRILSHTTLGIIRKLPETERTTEKISDTTQAIETSTTTSASTTTEPTTTATTTVTSTTTTKLTTTPEVKTTSPKSTSEQTTAAQVAAKIAVLEPVSQLSQECNQRIIFTVSANPWNSAETDRLNSVSKVLLAESVAECAAKCYGIGCLEARFIPESQTCFLSHKLTDEVSTACDTAHSNFVDSFETSSKIQIVHVRCVTCGTIAVDTTSVPKKDSDAQQLDSIQSISEDTESIISSGTQEDNTENDQECELSFEVTSEKLFVPLVLKNSTLVDNVDQCARNCYNQGCQLAEFAPALVSQGSKKAYCYLYTSTSELCSSTAERITSFAKYDKTLVKCIKCESKATTSTGSPDDERTTEYALKIWQNHHEKEKEDPAESVDQRDIVLQTTPPWGYFPDACVITFEVSSALEEILNGHIRFTNSTITRSAAVCAQTCYQSGCIGAGYDPQAGSCLMAYGINERCVHTERTAIYTGAEQIVLQCLRCDISYQGPIERQFAVTRDPPTKAVRTVTEEIVTATKTVAALKISEAESSIKIHEETAERSAKVPWRRTGSGLCVVSFEVAEIDATANLQFRNGTNEPRSAGECAQKCYRDGCTLAGWDPISRYCFFYYGRRELCAESRRYHTYNPEYPVWLQCLRCGPRHLNRDPRIPAIATTPYVPETTGTTTTTTSQPTTTPTTEPTTTTTSTTATSTTAATTRRTTTNAATTAKTGLSTEKTAETNTTSLPPSSKTSETSTTLGAAFVQGEETTATEKAVEKSTSVVALKQAAEVGAVQELDSKTHTELSSEQTGTTESSKTPGTAVAHENDGITDASTTARHVSIITAPPKPCAKNLTFELSLIRFINDFRYEEQRKARTTAECAQTCFEAACTIAGFIPATGLCLLSFAREACYDKARRFGAHFGTEVVRLDCIRCGGSGSDKVLTSLSSSRESEVRGFPATSISQQRLDSKPQTIKFDHLKPKQSNIETGIFRQIKSGSECPGRLVFQALAVESLPKLNVTNDVFAKSPADCAQKCWDVNCTTAGFIPNPAHDGGVCLLSKDSGMCKDETPLVPQYGDLRPFVISCITCSACKYSLSLAIPTSVLPRLNIQTDAVSLTECAVRCYQVNCTAAAYSDRAEAGNCLLSTEGAELCSKPDDLELYNSQDALPLKLDCVRCDAEN